MYNYKNRVLACFQTRPPGTCLIGAKLLQYLYKKVKILLIYLVKFINCYVYRIHLLEKVLFNFGFDFSRLTINPYIISNEREKKKTYLNY